jgi:hypothetical protein
MAYKATARLSTWQCNTVAIYCSASVSCGSNRMISVDYMSSLINLHWSSCPSCATRLEIGLSLQSAGVQCLPVGRQFA